MINLRKILAKGQRAIDATKAKREDGLKKTLRVGSAGCVTYGSDWIGECARIAHLRFNGIDKPFDDNIKIMFQGGEANELIWEAILEKGLLGEPWKMVRDADLRNEVGGVPIKGSPDILLENTSDLSGSSQHVVLELKSLHAASSATQRALGNPELKHLVQTACYMWLLDCPGILCYTNRNMVNLQFDRKKYKDEFPSGKIGPYHRLFYCHFDDEGLFHWTDEDKYSFNIEPFTNSSLGISKTGLEVFFKKVAAETWDEFPPRPAPISASGETLPWTPCKYCVFSDDCDLFEGDYDVWVDACRRTAEK